MFMNSASGSDEKNGIISHEDHALSAAVEIGSTKPFSH
jgi:hypothetical protein